ncbi:MAG: hypothetical protein FWD87_11300 [Spirochaetaceae bacterium]|nr:hypothetical protein [Spirochaetaceae bacterium]
MGYILKTFSSTRYIEAKYLYKGRDSIVDLRKLEDSKYMLMSGETIAVYTNEYIELDKKHFALILSRVSGEAVGFVVSTTYADPEWSGLLQLIITNKSEQALEVSLDMKLAKLVLFEIKEEGNFQDTQHPHRNLTWSQMEIQPEYPSWAGRKLSFFTSMRHKFLRKKKIFFVTVFMAIVLIVSLIVSNVTQNESLKIFSIFSSIVNFFAIIFSFITK